jgi:TorA maturation chaperone TorD
MRWLVDAARPLVDQRVFFETYLYPGAAPFCAAVQSTASAVFYGRVAAFALAFFDLEKAAFDMVDSGPAAH